MIPAMSLFAVARMPQMFMLRRLEQSLKATPPEHQAAAISTWYDPRRREITEALRKSDQVWLNSMRLLANLRVMRWDHPNQQVRDVVLAALQMQAVVHAETALVQVGEQNADDNKDANNSRREFGAEFDEKATSGNKRDTMQWCGAFAMFNLSSGGWEPDLYKAFCHADNVTAFFKYHLRSKPDRLKPWIFNPTTLLWEEVGKYHASRQSSRRWQNINKAADLDNFEGSGPRAGDVVVASGTNKHVAMVQSWDPVTHVLVLIDGNDKGYRLLSPGEKDHDANESPQERRAESITGRNLKRGSGQPHVGVRIKDYGKDGRRDINVTFIGRPSTIDFEDHYYSDKEMPTLPERK